MESLELLSIPSSLGTGLRLLLKNSFIHAVQDDAEDDLRGKSNIRRHSAPPKVHFSESSTLLGTTLMMRNIPSKFNQETLLARLSSEFDLSTVDFFYLPIDFKSGKCLGYAFLNFVSGSSLGAFMSTFSGSELSESSNKKLDLSLAKVQGLERNYNLFKASSVMTYAPPQFRPMIKCPTCGQLSPLTSHGDAMCVSC